MLALFLQEADLANCSSLRLLFCSGEALPAALAQALGGRSEKQAQANRQALPKLARTSQITPADLQQLCAKRLIVHRQFRDLPPRLLPAQHSSPHSSRDDDDPALS